MLIQKDIFFWEQVSSIMLDQPITASTTRQKRLVLKINSKEFESIDVLVKYIKKYGPNMITLAPDLIFKASENYPKIVNSVCEYVDSLYENIKCENFLNYALKVITEYTTKFKPKAQSVSRSELYPNKIFAKNIIEANSLRKQIYNLFAIIGLV